MKDLLVYVADTDAEVFLRAVLGKPQALKIRAIDFDIRRHPQRDSGMVQSGAGLASLLMGNYQKALLVLDYQGSGRDTSKNPQTPKEVQEDIQRQLGLKGLAGKSAVAVLVPELEQWLWFCEAAVARHCGMTGAQLAEKVEECAAKLGKAADSLKTEQPKELFEYVMLNRAAHRQKALPRDFEEIGKIASIPGLMQCPSFAGIAKTLQAWFP
jgi:hypothetical protein